MSGQKIKVACVMACRALRKHDNGIKNAKRLVLSSLFSPFHGATLIQKIIDMLRCGENPRKKKKGLSMNKAGLGTLRELLKQPQSWPENEEEIRNKEKKLEEMKRVANMLRQQSELDLVLEGAQEVRRLSKGDSWARMSLALLGVIPALVALLDAQDQSFRPQIAALYALLNLSIADNANKGAIVKAGAIHKMLKLIQSPEGSANQAIAEVVAANLLSLTALDANKQVIGSSGAIAFLVKTIKDLDETINSQAKQDSLRALYNLSILPSNVFVILETDLVPFLLTKIGDMDVSERILSILGNIVLVAEGQKAISSVPDALLVLMDVLSWMESPGCQEKASYILMVMAHKSFADKQAMIEAGIVSSLLELTLLGSILAQKRACRLLECLRMDKGKQVSGGGGSSITLSAPLHGSSSSSVDQIKQMELVDKDMISEEEKAVKQLVQQSLQNNLRRMVKRANLPHDFLPPDHFKSIRPSSTSKSLPF